MPIKNSIIIDSNILIDYFTFSNKATLANIKTIIRNGVYINHCTITEVTNYLKNRYNHSLAYTVQFKLLYDLNYQILDISTEVTQVAMQIAKKYKDLELAYNDCLLLAQSNIYALPILTDDEAMWSVKEANFSYLS